MFYDGHPRAEPGAIVCRVAPSFIRLGNFELPASRGDAALVRELVDFTIRRDFPHLLAAAATGCCAASSRSTRRSAAAWFDEVCERTARMIAHWMRVGFVHGVMNTDNLSVLGLTIDYGPYGWIDDFDLAGRPTRPMRTGRRYRFGAQPQIAHWNLGQLANALAPVFASTEPLYAGLERYIATYEQAERANAAAKLGLVECIDDDMVLIHQLYALLQAGEVDMTLFFPRARGCRSRPADAFSLRRRVLRRGEAAQRGPAFVDWLTRYAARARQDGVASEARRTGMHRANPRYVPAQLSRAAGDRPRRSRRRCRHR
jgi:uncharacterized protein YdiU (UPF0061 family)